MRKLFPPLVSLGLLTMACSGGDRLVLSTAPSAPSAQASPAPRPPFTFAERFTTITVGEVISRHVTADDPPCAGFPEFRCLYFRLTAASAGTLEVVVTTLRGVGSQLQDVSVTDAGGGELWGPIGGRVNVALRAGTTYQITVWYAAPGVELELRTSFGS